MAVYQRGSIWYIDYYVSGRRIREKIGTNKKLAETILHKRTVEALENKHLDIRKDQKVRFEDFVDEYVELHLKPNNKSWERSELHNIKRLTKYFAGKYLTEITPLAVEKFKIERRSEVGPATTKGLIVSAEHI